MRPHPRSFCALLDPRPGRSRNQRLLRDHREELLVLTDALLERNELNTKEVLEILGPNGTNGHQALPETNDGGEDGRTPEKLSASIATKAVCPALEDPCH